MRLAKSAKRSVAQALKVEEKKNKQLLRDKEKDACPNCGKNNPENSVYCSQCGSKLSHESAEETKTIISSEPRIVEDNFLDCILPEYDIKIKYPATWHRIDKQDLKPPMWCLHLDRRKKLVLIHFLRV